MKVLVTGCNGFIGSYVCNRLWALGHLVYGLGKKQVSKTQLNRYYSVDIASQAEVEDCAEILGRIDAIVHCAAYISYDNTDSRIMQVNAIGTQNIISLAKSVEAHKFVYCSSLPVIGTPTELPITEDHPLAPRTMYHVSKLAGEYIVNTSDIASVILRIPSPIGVGMNQSTILPVFISKSLRNEPILIHGTGSRVQNYISVSDISNAILLSLTKNVSGCFNLSGDAISNIELARLCRKVLCSNSEIVFSGKPDPADQQVWDICGERAAQELGFTAEVQIERSIQMLADQISAVRRIE